MSDELVRAQYDALQSPVDHRPRPYAVIFYNARRQADRERGIVLRSVGFRVDFASFDYRCRPTEGKLVALDAN